MAISTGCQRVCVPPQSAQLWIITLLCLVLDSILSSKMNMKLQAEGRICFQCKGWQFLKPCSSDLCISTLSASMLDDADLWSLYTVFWIVSDRWLDEMHHRKLHALYLARVARIWVFWCGFKAHWITRTSSNMFLLAFPWASMDAFASAFDCANNKVSVMNIGHSVGFMWFCLRFDVSGWGT